MTRNEVFATVVSGLEQIAEDAHSITGKSRPIGDLGLDSEDGIDWICDMDSQGFDVPNDVNPFVDKKGRRPRTVDEITDLLMRYVVEEGGNG